ncbi:hypothetical protein KAR91_18925 [Candidatus Pacearchaeota archaeon]|nr:hypothetical protein [Candidatus Pacearchaeota archaeon]
MSDVKDAEVVAGILLGKKKCMECRRWFLRDELVDYGGNLVWYVCQECKSEYEAYKRVTS